METTEEQWRQIPDRFGKPSKYSISTLGRVRTAHTGHEGKIMKGGEGPEGTGAGPRRVWLMDIARYNSYSYRVDWLMGITWMGEPPDGVWRVAHKNGRVWDDRLDNLVWVGDLPRATLAPTPLQGARTVEQARAAEKEARKGLDEAVRVFVAATRELAVAEAREGVQRAVQALQEEHGKEGGTDGLG